MAERTTVARWESRSGKWWVELDRTELDDGRVAYGYSAVGAGGNLGLISESAAFAEIERRLDVGLFQPDANTTPLTRVA